jgi:hypothetical protein
MDVTRRESASSELDRLLHQTNRAGPRLLEWPTALEPISVSAPMFDKV